MGLALDYMPRYTIEDYKLWEGEWELIEGIPYAMTPSPFGVHQAVMMEIGRQISNQLEGCSLCFVYPELDWIIDEHTVVRPDLMVVCKKIKEHLKEPPQVAIEVVSSSTASKDEIVKFYLYEKEGVDYYMLVYPELRKARIFQLKDGKFQKVFDGENGVFEFNLKGRCKLSIDFSKVWQKI